MPKESQDSTNSTVGESEVELAERPWAKKLMFAAKIVGVMAALATPAAATAGWAFNEVMEARDKSFADLDDRVDGLQETLDEIEQGVEGLRSQIEQNKASDNNRHNNMKAELDSVEDNVTAVGHALQLVRTEIRFRHANSSGASARASRASREAGEVLGDL